MNEWQPIETAPKGGVRVLVCVTFNLSDVEFETIQWVDWQCPKDGRWWAYRDRIDIPFPPSHWQPLPLPTEDTP